MQEGDMFVLLSVHFTPACSCIQEKCFRMSDLPINCCDTLFYIEIYEKKCEIPQKHMVVPKNPLSPHRCQNVGHLFTPNECSLLAALY